MGRVKNGAVAFAVVGATAAVWAGDQDAFVAGFFWVFFGGIAAMVAMVAGAAGNKQVYRGRGRKRLMSIDMNPYGANAGGLALMDDRVHGGKEPFVDANGIHRYHGDIFDFENQNSAGSVGRA